MKVYAALFNKDEYERKSFALYGDQMQQFKNVFPDYKKQLWYGINEQFSGIWRGT